MCVHLLSKEEGNIRKATGGSKLQETEEKGAKTYIYLVFMVTLDADTVVSACVSVYNIEMETVAM